MVVQFERLDPVENENLQLFHLVQEFILNLLLVFVKVLHVFLVICWSDHREAMPLFEETLNQIPDPVLLCNLLTESLCFF